MVFSHEVIEHVTDDAGPRPRWRSAGAGGRIVLFCPDRLYPFETPTLLAWDVSLRQHAADQLAAGFAARPARPHVRAYTGAGLRDLFRGSRWRSSTTANLPGFDNVVARHRARAVSCGRAIRAGATPMQWSG